MKKLLAAILALSTAAALNVTALADAAIEEYSDTGRSISFDKDKDGLVLAPETVLTPKETYYFPILVTDGADTKDMTADQFKNYRFSFIVEEGKGAISSMKVEKYKTRYCLAITAGLRSPTEVYDVEYTIKVTDKTDNSEIVVSQLRFKAGYPAMPDSGVQNPDYVLVNPKTPVITEDQFKDLDDTADGDRVTLAYDDWEYAVKVRGMKDTNLVTNSKDIDAVIEKYPDNEFKFVTFEYGPAFRTDGTLTVDVSGDMNAFEDKFFVYMYDNGKMVPMTSKLNEEAQELTIVTKQLGRFVITNKAITDLTVTTPTTPNPDTTTPDTTNPGTGAMDFTPVSVTLAAGLLGVVLALTKKRK